MPLVKAPYAIGSHAYFFRDAASITAHTHTTKRARSAANVATLTTATAHGLWIGAIVAIASMGGTGYNNATAVVATVPTTTSFTYANTGDPESETADTAGTVTQTGVASRTNKPGPDDTAWIDLGVIEEASDSPVASEKIDIFAPTPGLLRKYDVVEVKRQRKGKLKCRELSPLALQTLYRTAALTESSTQFNALEGSLVKGWLKVQRYDQNDTLRITEDLYCILEVSGDVNFGGGALAEVEFEYDVLHSTLNTGTL